jgi:hypothetical protein
MAEETCGLLFALRRQGKWVPADRLRTGDDHGALFQLESKDPARERHRYARTVSHDRVEVRLNAVTIADCNGSALAFGQRLQRSKHAAFRSGSPGHPLATDLIASGGLHVACIKRQFKRNPAAEAVAQMLRRRRDASGIQREIAQRFS